jgi:hypothetical protein
LLCAEPAESRVDNHLPDGAAKIDSKRAADRAAALCVADQDEIERLGLLHEDVELRGVGKGRDGGADQPGEA